MFKSFFAAFARVGLVTQIIAALFLGILFSFIAPQWADKFAILGTFFVKALKSVAPILVFLLTVSAIAKHQSSGESRIRDIIYLYLFGTFFAAVCAVSASFMFQPTLILRDITPESVEQAPTGLDAVLGNLLMNIADNPLSAIANGNYIGILAWSILLGVFLRHASGTTKTVLDETSDAVSFVVRCVIRFAPFGIFSLVYMTLAETRFGTFVGTYAQLLAVLLGCMFFVALVVNPLIVFLKIRKNPYPLVFTCLRESGLTAFLTRSSAANIPVNLSLCKKLGLNENTYAISIPLGASINMAGAAVTITVMTLAAANTLGLEVGLWHAVLLSVIAAVGACGASGVAGGSLLLIPMACSLFGISGDIAAQVIVIGQIIGVLQDSTETALNSSTDVLFTAAAEMAHKE